MGKDVRGALVPYYQFDIHDERGQLKKRSRRRLCHSFVIGYIQLLAMKMAALPDQTITDTGGTGRAVDKNTYLQLGAALGTTTYGNVVGTGSTAVAFTNTALGTKINHGTGAGQLSYGACVVNLPSSDSTSTSMVVTRPFSNGSSGAITINEIGLYAQILYGGGTQGYVCIVRDLATIALSVGDQLTLNYILKTVV